MIPSFTLDSVKPMDQKFMKISKLSRFSLEMNRNDTIAYGDLIAKLIHHGYELKVTIEPIGIEGEDNGHEQGMDADEYRY